MTQSLPPGLKGRFLWCPELGIGWHSAPPMEYSGEYFENYQRLDATPMGAALTKARVELVSKYTDPSTVCDIGIGGGRFVQESGGWGYDISKEANAWLKSINRWRKPGDEWHSPEDRKVPAITCWDSLEHIPDPEELLANVSDWLFVSMPIYQDVGDILGSKHFKPGEHLWYHTLPGFIAWCEALGFECREVNHAETELGREGITSFAFKRVA